MFSGHLFVQRNLAVKERWLSNEKTNIIGIDWTGHQTLAVKLGDRANEVQLYVTCYARPVFEWRVSAW